MKRLRTLCIAWAIELVVALAGAQAPVASAADAGGGVPTVAVLNFAPGTRVEGEESLHAAGPSLADYFEQTLIDRGAVVVERRAIKAVLSERALEAFTEPDDKRSKSALLSAALLVTGTVEQPDPGAFRLRVALIRSRDAMEVAGYVVEGVWPDDVLSGLEKAAEALMPHLRDQSRPAPPRVLEGFTDNPEAAMMYYRGLDHLGRDQLAEAIAYLNEAGELDKNFLLARVWLMRCLRRAGFPDFAQAVADDLARRSPEADLSLKALSDAHRERDRLVVLVIGAAEDARVTERVVDLLRRADDINVLGASWIASAASEHDLKLSGRFETLPVAVDRWLFADAVVRVDAERVTLCDAVTGRMIAALPHGNADDLPRRLVEAWRADAVAEVEARDEHDYLTRGLTASPSGDVFYAMGELLRTGADEPMREVTPGSRVYRVSRVMQRLIDAPNDLANLWAAAALWQSFSTPAALTRMIRLIAAYPDTPQAADWLSTALYFRENWNYFTSDEPIGIRWEAEPTVREQYQSLLDLFPESAAARIAEYGLGHELMLAGQRDQAIALWERLANDLPELRFVDNEKPTHRTHVALLFHLSRAHFEMGRVPEARRWFDACIEVRGTPNWLIHPVMVASMHCAKDKVAWHVCGRNELTHRVFHSLRLGDRNDLRPQIQALEWRLAAAETGYVQAGPYRDSGQLLLDWLDEDDSRKRFELGLATVRQYPHEHTPKVEIPDYVVQLAAWLRLHSRNFGRVEEAIDAIRLLLPLAYSRHTRLTLHKLAGDIDEAQALIDEGLKYRSIDSRAEFIYERVALDSLRLSPQEQAAQLLDMLTGLERVCANDVKAGSLAYYTLVERIGPILMELYRPAEAVKRYRKIVEDARIPQFYRDRAAYRMALGMARNGDVAGGVEVLRDVLDRAARREAEPVTWDVPAAQKWMIYGYRRIPPVDIDELKWAVQESLHRLRLYGGRPVATQQATPGELLDAEPISRDLLPELYALAELASVPSHFHDAKAKNHWAREAIFEMIHRGGDAAGASLVRRLLFAQTCDKLSILDPERRAAWKTLGAICELPEAAQPSQELLLDWLVWSPICEIKRNSGFSIMKLGREDRQVVASLVLGSAMIGGCEGAARDALRKVSDPDAAAAPTLANLLSHPMVQVRQYAAETLARIVGVDVEVNKRGLPTDDAVAALSAWWSESGKDPAHWPVQRWRELPGHYGPIQNAVISPDGRGMITAGAGPIAWYWDLLGNRPPTALNHNRAAWVQRVCFTPDGRCAVTSAQDHRLRVFDLDKPGRCMIEWDVPAMVYRLAVSPNGRRLATDDADRVALYDLATGKRTHTFEKPGHWTNALAFTPDGMNLIATGARDGRLVVFDLATGQRTARLAQHAAQVNTAQAIEDRLLLTASTDKTARLWNLDLCREVGRFTHQAWVGTAAMSPDGSLMATGDGDGRVSFWTVADQQVIRQMDLTESDAAVLDVGFNADGHLWAVTREGVAFLLEPGAGVVIRTLRLGPDPKLKPRLLASGTLRWPDADALAEGDDHHVLTIAHAVGPLARGTAPRGCDCSR